MNIGQAMGVEEHVGSAVSRNGKPVKVERAVIEALKQTTYIEAAVVTLAVAALEDRRPLTLGPVELTAGQEFDLTAAVKAAISIIGDGQRMGRDKLVMATKAVKLAWIEFANRVPMAEGFESRLESFFRQRKEEEKLLRRKGYFGKRLKSELKQWAREARKNLGEVEGTQVEMLQTLPDEAYKTLRKEVEDEYATYLNDLIERHGKGKRPARKPKPKTCHRHRQALLEKGDHIPEGASKRLEKIIKSKSETAQWSIYRKVNTAVRG